MYIVHILVIYFLLGRLKIKQDLVSRDNDSQKIAENKTVE